MSDTTLNRFRKEAGLLADAYGLNHKVSSRSGLTVDDLAKLDALLIATEDWIKMISRNSFNLNWVDEVKTIVHAFNEINK